MDGWIGLDWAGREGVSLTIIMIGCSSREVHKARHRSSGALVALKKILMHNAKEDGVSLLPPLFPFGILFSSCYHARPLAHVLSLGEVIRDVVFYAGFF